MNKIICRFMCAVAAIALTIGSYVSASALAIASNTYYVSVTGNDANACASVAPCKTFARAMSLAQPGDIVHVLPGTYTQQLVISKSSIIVEGDNAVISTSAQNGINVVSTAQNVTVRGFTVTGTKSHVIFVSGQFITIENNIVHDAITENGVYPNCRNGQRGSAIKAERGSSNVTIRGNQVYRTCGEGIASTMSHDVTISGNTVYDNYSVNVYVDNSYNVNVTGNTVYCTKTTNNPVGIALGEESYTGWGAQLKGVTVSGNVVTNCSSGIIAFGSNVGGTLTNVTINNNFVPSGQSKGISLDNAKNANVSIIKNTYYNQPWIRSSAGVTMSENVVSSQLGTPVPLSRTPTATATQPTVTATAILPTVTAATIQPTVTATAILPTVTATAIQPTVTASSTLVTSANTYYVSVTGNDANACASVAPCKTFARAMSLAQPGDIVHVLPGTYTQQLVISKSSIIVEGDNAVISTSAQNGINVASTAQNVTVRGFTVTGTKSHVIFVSGQFITIENNIVHDAITENGIYPNCGSGQWGSAIKAERGSSNVTIRGNQVYRTCGEGIASTMSHDVTISGNTVYDNHSVNVYVDNSYNINVTGNTVYCTKTTNNPVGIALGEESYTGWGAQLKGVTVSGNVVTNCSSGIIAFGSNVGGTLTNVTINNNFVPSGQSKGISLDNAKNANVSIIKNTYYNQPWIRSSAGVTMSENVVSSQLGTSLAAKSASTSGAALQATSSSAPSPAAPTPTPTLLPTATESAAPASPTVTATSTPVEPATTPTTQPALETVYDDKDSAFVYSEGWSDVSIEQAYNGSFKQTTQKDSFMTFTFTGQSFSVLYEGGSAFEKMDVYVDDALAGTIIENTAETSFQQRWDYAAQLAPGNHTLKLVFVTTDTSNTTNGSIDAVIVR